MEVVKLFGDTNVNRKEAVSYIPAEKDSGERIEHILKMPERG
jgi:hypothetical protein